jgi:RNA polymerase sigma-70 factor (ECF subfamily)
MTTLLAEPPVVDWYARDVTDATDPDLDLDLEGLDGTPATGIAEAARDRVRFEEDALALADDVWRVARRLARDQAQAEDLVQEAYSRAFRSWRSFQPGTNLRAWLLRIVHNLAIDQARRRKRAPDQEPLEEGDYYLYNRLEAGTGGGTGETAASERLIDRLSQTPVVGALSELPPNYREVVVLVDLADFTYQDAADILGIPIGTVMSRLHRGRRMLKTQLAELAGARAGKET